MKRTLKQQAKYSEKIILEKNKDFYDDFVAKNYSTEKQKKKVSKSLLITIGSTLAAVLVLVLSLVLFWPPQDEGKRYLQENEQTTISSITELNADLSGVSLTFASIYDVKVDRKFDSETSDTLCYAILLISDLEEIKLTIYTNAYYEHKKQLDEDFQTTQIGKFKVDYYENIEQDDIIFHYTYSAITEEYNDVIIFIEYEEISLDSTSNFFNFFEQTIKKV